MMKYYFFTQSIYFRNRDLKAHLYLSIIHWSSEHNALFSSNGHLLYSFKKEARKLFSNSKQNSEKGKNISINNYFDCPDHFPVLGDRSSGFSVDGTGATN